MNPNTAEKGATGLYHFYDTYQSPPVTITDDHTF